MVTNLDIVTSRIDFDNVVLRSQTTILDLVISNLTTSQEQSQEHLFSVESFYFIAQDKCHHYCQVTKSKNAEKNVKLWNKKNKTKTHPLLLYK